MSPEAPELAVVYVDEDLLIVDKPAGLLSCPGRGEGKLDSVQTRVPRVFPSARGSLLGHRLDQATSGLLAIGLHPAAHRSLQQQFERRVVEKQYEAVLMGDVALDEGRIELPQRLDVERRPLQTYDPVHGKLGVTCWRVLERTAVDRRPRTRVCFTPLTGRTHQLRLQAAHPLGLGCPIAGDPLYGDPRSAPRLLLHARELKLAHPGSGEPVTFRSVVPF